MGKLSAFMMVMFGIMMLMFLAGYQTSSTNIIKDVNTIFSGGDFQNTQLFIFIAAAVVILATGGVVSVFTGFISSSTAFTIVAGASMSIYLWLFLSDMYQVISQARANCIDTTLLTCSDWVAVVVTVLIIVIVIGYIWAAIEWMMGDH